MAINRDFKDLFAALNAAGVRYLLVGGYALAVHTAPRFTKDLDVWVDATPGNAVRLIAALRSFGVPLHAISEADFAGAGVVFQIGIAPNRVDVLTSIDGVRFEDAWPARVSTTYGDQPVSVIGRVHLIINKRAVGRPQDIVDADLLEQQHPEP